MGEMRWPLATDDASEQELFPQGLRVVGKGEYRGLEFLEVDAKTIINKVPGPPRFGFQYTINAYRGCSHACEYCLAGDTPVLLADLSTRPISDLRIGDDIIGTTIIDGTRRYVATQVLDHWRTTRSAFRIRTAAGQSLVASGDHRFLSDRGWKHVTGRMAGKGQRPYLTTNNSLRGFGPSARQPKHSVDYMTGYLAGMIRGDGHLGEYEYPRPGRTSNKLYRFRLALADLDALARSQEYLRALGVEVDRFQFSSGSASTRPMEAIRSQRRGAYVAIRRLVSWPESPTDEWRAGFLAGIFDAEGSGSALETIRIANRDEALVAEIMAQLEFFGFDSAVDRFNGEARSVRFRGGAPEALRFIQLTDPAIARKRRLVGAAVKTSVDLKIRSIEDLGITIPMYDITTGTGDFIADGVVSHNCFARPTHDYLGLNIGEDFNTKIVVKRNAVERARAETSPVKWGGDLIAMGTNTDPYQAAEGKYRLTRGLLEVMVERSNPVSILTKSSLVLRDVDVLTELGKRTKVRVDFSVGTVDEAVWKATEPGTPHPMRRLDAVAKLNAAGVRSGVLMGPVLPGLSDSPEQLHATVKAAVEAGAISVGHVPLHLGLGVKAHFIDWVASHRPDLLPMYEDLYSGKGKQAASRYRAWLGRTIGDLLWELGGPEPIRPRQQQIQPKAAARPNKSAQLALDLG